MRRFSAWLVGPLMLATIGAAAGPAAAAGARPSVSPGAIAGQYTAYGNYGDGKWVQFSLTLNRDHTGTDHFNDTIVWSTSGKDITMTFDDGLWTYLGRKTKTGLNRLSVPGTLSNINGGSGIWYAVKLS
jgi:hypothetical protein